MQERRLHARSRRRCTVSKKEMQVKEESDRWAWTCPDCGRELDQSDKSTHPEKCSKQRPSEAVAHVHDYRLVHTCWTCGEIEPRHCPPQRTKEAEPRLPPSMSSASEQELLALPAVMLSEVTRERYEALRLLAVNLAHQATPWTNEAWVPKVGDFVRHRTSGLAEIIAIDDAEEYPIALRYKVGHLDGATGGSRREELTFVSRPKQGPNEAEPRCVCSESAGCKVHFRDHAEQWLASAPGYIRGYLDFLYGPRTDSPRCFHVDAGKRCTRYLEGAEGERAAVVKWLRWEAEHRTSPTAQRLLDAANDVESRVHLRHRADGVVPQCPSTDGDVRCVFGEGHLCDYHSDGDRRWPVQSADEGGALRDRVVQLESAAGFVVRRIDLATSASLRERIDALRLVLGGGSPRTEPARLDTDGTAKPKMEIMAVMPESAIGKDEKTIHVGQATHYVIRPMEHVCQRVFKADEAGNTIQPCPAPCPKAPSEDVPDFGAIADLLVGADKKTIQQALRNAVRGQWEKHCSFTCEEAGDVIRLREEALDADGNILGAICVASMLRPGERLKNPPDHASFGALMSVIERAERAEGVKPTPPRPPDAQKIIENLIYDYNNPTLDIGLKEILTRAWDHGASAASSKPPMTVEDWKDVANGREEPGSFAALAAREFNQMPSAPSVAYAEFHFCPMCGDPWHEGTHKAFCFGPPPPKKADTST